MDWNFCLSSTSIVGFDVGALVKCRNSFCCSNKADLSGVVSQRVASPFLCAYNEAHASPNTMIDMNAARAVFMEFPLRVSGSRTHADCVRRRAPAMQTDAAVCRRFPG